jgi:hypothetical protein
VNDADGDPSTWRLKVRGDRVEPYLQLRDHPRPLSVDEAAMMVELVDAWRELEQAKHLALKRTTTTRSPD